MVSARTLMLAWFAGMIAMASGCSKKEVTVEQDIDKLLQGARGRWVLEQYSTDEKTGDTIGQIYYVTFYAPNLYRWRTIVTRNHVEVPELCTTVTGTYLIEGDTITFTPDNGTPWSATFEFREENGSLVLTKSNGEIIQLEHMLSGTYS